MGIEPGSLGLLPSARAVGQFPAHSGAPFRPDVACALLASPAVPFAQTLFGLPRILPEVQEDTRDENELLGVSALTWGPKFHTNVCAPWGEAGIGALAGKMKQNTAEIVSGKNVIIVTMCQFLE